MAFSIIKNASTDKHSVSYSDESVLIYPIQQLCLTGSRPWYRIEIEKMLLLQNCIISKIGKYNKTIQ